MNDYNSENVIRKFYRFSTSFQQISAKKVLIYCVSKKMRIFAGNFSQKGIEIVNKKLKDKKF